MTETGPAVEPRAQPGSDVSISMERANIIGLWAIPAAAAGMLIPFAAVWSFAELARGFDSLLSFWIIPALIGVVVVHEGLHGVGFLLGGVSPRNIHFGVHKETMSPYAGCRVPTTASIYRLAVILPALLMGAVPWIIAMAYGSGELAIFSTFMIIFAAGDLIVLWTIRSLPGRVRVLDHPNRVGCSVLDG
jgi:hypothetical protein